MVALRVDLDVKKADRRQPRLDVQTMVMQQRKIARFNFNPCGIAMMPDANLAHSETL